MDRIFVRKKEGFQVESLSLRADLMTNLGETKITTIDLYNVYDIQGASAEDLTLLKQKVLAEVVTDDVFESVSLDNCCFLCIENLPGQYDQRADSAEQCLRLLNTQSVARIKSARLMVFHGQVASLERISQYLINPIESRAKILDNSWSEEDTIPLEVTTCKNFISLSKNELAEFLQDYSLAMSLADLSLIQNYFREQEQRNPTETEIKVLDTYWSDHCRHTTFETFLEDIKINNTLFQKELQDAFNRYLILRAELGRENKPITLMDLATIGARALKKQGVLDNLEESEENNACSIEIIVDNNGIDETWLLMFKNETHNHPTEIEPFGGASTCIGGAIRDPLSGRAYVYQAMRITGAGDITQPLANTLPNKLPQVKISQEAAAGNSSYGNQIGLSSTFVKEIYHKGYTAKRMEVGVVVGAVPKMQVRRKSPSVGDVVVILGGRTGRDGIGGATGSSKEHNELSLELCASEVQKGNAPIERRLQRLFRNPKTSCLIKKSNDFGAGGVCVALGEIARGVDIDLDTILVKYKGLNGTELAISESQERMAVVLSPEDVCTFLRLAEEENIETSVTAKIIADDRLIIRHKGLKIVDIARTFLDTNGASRSQKVEVTISGGKNPFQKEPISSKIEFLQLLQELNTSSQRGMVEMFDSSIGRSTVLMPYGGKKQLSEAESSVQKLPVSGFTNTCSLLSYGFNPYISSYDPFLGAQWAVIESLARLTATGGNFRKARLSFQEYFERLGDNPQKYGKPFAALLGSLEAQMQFSVPAIGGKDSMSGSYKDLDVPPTLISFAICHEKTQNIISSEFKQQKSVITLISAPKNDNNIPKYQEIIQNYTKITQLVREKRILAMSTVKFGGIAEAVFKMSFGNEIGATIKTSIPLNILMPGSIIVESLEPLGFGTIIGQTNSTSTIEFNEIKLTIKEAIQAWEEPFKKIYPYTISSTGPIIQKDFNQKTIPTPKIYTKPKTLIAVFPGTNCEYDTKKAFQKTGAESEIFVFNNLNGKHIENSISLLSSKIEESQILVIPGGFSLGDEPDGSGKFIANVLQNKKVSSAIQTLLGNNGLILGICNGFQALIKSGLLPYGTTASLPSDAPTLFRNDINRHISRVCSTRVSSLNSPWLSSFTLGEIHHIALSHGEGKLIIPTNTAETLFANGQVAFQYCDDQGQATMDEHFNLNGSMYAIEGLLSPCGKILGKMGHSERYEEGLLLNITGNKEQNIFQNGVNYLRGIQ